MASPNNKRRRCHSRQPSSNNKRRRRHSRQPSAPSVARAAVAAHYTPNGYVDLGTFPPMSPFAQQFTWKPTSILPRIPRESTFDFSLEDALLSQPVKPTPKEFAEAIANNPRVSVIATMGLTNIVTNLDVLQNKKKTLQAEMENTERHVQDLRNDIVPVMQERDAALKELQAAQAKYDRSNAIYESADGAIEQQEIKLSECRRDDDVLNRFIRVINRIRNAPFYLTPFGPGRAPESYPMDIVEIRRRLEIPTYQSTRNLTGLDIAAISHIAKTFRYDNHPFFLGLWQNASPNFLATHGPVPEIRYSHGNGLPIAQQQDRVAAYFGLTEEEDNDDVDAQEDGDEDMEGEETTEDIQNEIARLQQRLARRSSDPGNGDGGATNRPGFGTPGRRVVRAKRPSSGAVPDPSNTGDGGGPPNDGGGPPSDGSGNAAAGPDSSVTSDGAPTAEI